MAKVATVTENSEGAEHYSMKWKLCLYGMKESSTEDVRCGTIKILALLSPDNKERLVYLLILWSNCMITEHSFFMQLLSSSPCTVSGVSGGKYG